MDDVLELAIEACNEYELSFCKFISANDSGVTGGHQSGIYIPKDAYMILFNTPGVKGTNKERIVKIKWQSNLETESCFKYYGQKTRDEYRITRFGRGFPFLRDDHLGDLFILVKVDEEDYLAFLLGSEQEIETFLTNFGISPINTNRIINKINSGSHLRSLEKLFNEYICQLTVEFPRTQEVSGIAREIYYKSGGLKYNILKNPDHELIRWIEVEYSLFKYIENDRYKNVISSQFESVEKLIECANTLLNRRKSRAGKSLEHHLGEIFIQNKIRFTSQATTEGNKRPDFIFPGEKEYHNATFDINKLVFLAAKTTCKDRWRQILSEGDKVKYKHLITLQQGISSNQLKEMYDSNVILVIPKPYINTFPIEYRDKILNLSDFIKYLKEMQ